jgi:1,4-dihydroxy-6-naphthoate synthase
VARETRTPESLAGRRVAIPGKLTTAALLLRIECPDVVPVEVMFDDIPRAVREGEVDAGVIIHESQLTYRAEGLTKVLDFGELWKERDDLPVPLGLDVVRRDLGEPLMRACSAGFRKSIEVAFVHEDEAIRYALQFGRGLDTSQGKMFVHMYVNELTLEMGEKGRAGLKLLYERALACGAIAAAPRFDVV